MRLNAAGLVVFMGAFLLAFAAPRTLHSQTNADNRFGTSAISGTPSSARHCISGDAANVHYIGTVEAGAGYSITFDAEIPLTTALARLDFGGRQAAVGYGNPDLSFTASGSGSVALYVSGRGQAGCYRYKVEAESSAASETQLLQDALRNQAWAVQATSKAPKDVSGPMAISGLASSAKHCVAGNHVAAVHSIGRVEQGTQVRVTFSSNFDAIAGLTNVNSDSQSGTYVIDDDSGGNLDPLLNITASHPGTLALYVAGVSGRLGCYSYKVEITPPGTSSGVSLTGVVTVSGAGTRVSGATIRILDGANSGRTATTNANGEYRFDGLTSGNANLSANASGYSESRAGIFINGTNTLNFALQRAQLWSQSGQGNSVFDKPSFVTRARITGSFTGFSSNFVVWCGRSLLVNELLGTGWGTTRYEGTHSTSNCTEIRVENSSGVSWTFTEVR